MEAELTRNFTLTTEDDSQIGRRHLVLGTRFVDAMKVEHKALQGREVMLREAVKQAFHCRNATVNIAERRYIAEVLMKLKGEEGVWQLSEVVLESGTPGLSDRQHRSLRQAEAVRLHRGNSRDVIEAVLILQIERVSSVEV